MLVEEGGDLGKNIKQKEWDVKRKKKSADEQWKQLTLTSILQLGFPAIHLLYVFFST